MKIKLLTDGYKQNEKLKKDFFERNINYNAEYFSEDYVEVDKVLFFPIYIKYGSEEEKIIAYKSAVKTLYNNFIDLDRSIHFSERFWHSYIMYIYDEIHQIYESRFGDSIEERDRFYRNAIIRKFDWENYIYKSMLIAEYLKDMCKNEREVDGLIEIFVSNLDLMNYTIKYKVFRQPKFLYMLLKVIEEEDLSNILKKQLSTSEGKENDLRIGRLVIFDSNLSYPMIIPHNMHYKEFKQLILSLIDKYAPKETKKSKITTIFNSIKYANKNTLQS